MSNANVPQSNPFAGRTPEHPDELSGQVAITFALNVRFFENNKENSHAAKDEILTGPIGWAIIKPYELSYELKTNQTFTRRTTRTIKWGGKPQHLPELTLRMVDEVVEAIVDNSIALAPPASNVLSSITYDGETCDPETAYEHIKKWLISGIAASRTVDPIAEEIVYEVTPGFVYMYVGKITRESNIDITKLA